VVRRDGYFTEMKSRTWLSCLIFAFVPFSENSGEPSFDPLSTPVFPKYQSRLTTNLQAHRQVNDKVAARRTLSSSHLQLRLNLLPMLGGIILAEGDG